MKKGDLFIALQGTKDNGEKFIPDAVHAGAVAVLCEHAVPADVPIFDTPNVRKAASEIAVAFYNSHPDTLLGVTGTNGKTSTVFFVREMLKALGKNAASIGTLGVQSDKYKSYAGMTTADSITLNQDLKMLAENGVNYAAMEASSHGLDQYRLSGLHFKAAAFTNLTRDHLDYHKTMENYLESK